MRLLQIEGVIGIPTMLMPKVHGAAPLPLPSTALKNTAGVPFGKLELDIGVEVTLTGSQLSEAVGAVHVTEVAVHLATTNFFDERMVKIGAVSSTGATGAEAWKEAR